MDDAIHHILTVHFPPAILPSLSPLPRPDVQSDEYIQTLIDKNKEVTELLNALQEFIQTIEQSGGTQNESQHTGEEEEQSEDISFLELLDHQLVDSESDEEYIDSTYAGSSSSSSSSASSSSSTPSAAAQEATDNESQIAKSLRRNELIYDAETQSIVSLRTLLRKKQTLQTQTTSTSSSSSSMLVESPTALVTWDEEGDQEVLELEPYSSYADMDLASAPPNDDDMKELSELYIEVHSHWYDRIIKGFRYYSQRVLRQAPPQFLSSLSEHFSAYLESYSDVTGQDLDALFCSRSADTPYTAIYSYLAHGLVSAACSEASCERCFSILRWIVGNRRYSLSLHSLACLLSLCMSE